MHCVLDIVEFHMCRNIDDCGTDDVGGVVPAKYQIYIQAADKHSRCTNQKAGSADFFNYLLAQRLTFQMALAIKSIIKH